MKKLFLYLALLFTALSMAAGLAHLFELPNKINLSRADYFTVRQIYRGWALLGAAVLGALMATVVLAALVRHEPPLFYPTLAAAICVALSLAICFTFAFRPNQATTTGRMLRPTGRSCAPGGGIAMRPARCFTSSPSTCLRFRL